MKPNNICEECGKILDIERIRLNDEIANDPMCKGMKRLDYCEECWWNYSDHAITGD